jgi:FKBP-type peptidyl-prolyl cis-trans isomerase SlyD
MQISKNKVVAIDYTLTDNEGVVIDSSDGGEPLAYIQGIGNIIPGLEVALEGRQVGDNLKVTIKPDAAYGERDEELLQVVSKSAFGNPEQLEVGAQFEAQHGDHQHVYTVMEINGDKVTIDGNHPLAGVTLNFDVTVKEVRDATAEEMSHGHAHGAHGHGL